MSNKPVLYYAPRSPPCRAVLLTAAELGLDLDLRLTIVNKGDNMTPEFLKLNPQHTIPVLEDNGVVISDSHVICAYLADKYSKNESLYPKEVVARNTVLARLFYNCGHLFARFRNIVEPIFYFGSPDMYPEKIEYLQKAYDGLERCLIGNKYVCGNNMTIADLCCIATMSTAQFIAPVDKEKFPNILLWIERMSKLPYYQKSNKEGAEESYRMLLLKLEENKKNSK